MVSSPDLRLGFWQGFRAHMSEASDIGCSRPSSDGWMWHTADLSSGYLASLANVRLGQIGVRFRLNGPNADTVFSLLESRRADVDAALGACHVWRRGEGSSHVIEAQRSADLSLRHEWPAHMRWLQIRLESFQSALWPFVGRVPPAAGRRPWDERRFFSELSRWNPCCLEPAATILRSARQRGEAIQWGSGSRAGSYTPSVRHRGVAYQVVSARTDGTLQILFPRLKESQAFSGHARRLEILERLNRVRHVHLPESALGQRPAVPLAVFGERDACSQFVEVLGWFREVVTAA